ncbi:DNAJB8 [Symbiodinium sp. CCMP2592]|nr:DNAJB8 [Symbiodinium sp. CCMP2592]
MRLAFGGLLVILPHASAVCAGASAAEDTAGPNCNLDKRPQQPALHNRSGPADSPDDRDKRVWEEIKAGDAMDIAAGRISSLVVGAIKGDSGDKLAKSALSSVLDLGVAAISAKAPFVGPFVDIGITIFKDLVLVSSPPPPLMTEDDVKKMLEKFQVRAGGYHQAGCPLVGRKAALEPQAASPTTLCPSRSGFEVTVAFIYFFVPAMLQVQLLDCEALPMHDQSDRKSEQFLIRGTTLKRAKETTRWMVDNALGHRLGQIHSVESQRDDKDMVCLDSHMEYTRRRQQHMKEKVGRLQAA